MFSFLWKKKTQSDEIAILERARKDVDLVCPLSLSIYRDPVLAEDGHTYDRALIEQWLRVSRNAQGQPTSPFTRQPMGAKLVAQPQLKRRVDEWHAQALQAQHAPLQTLNSGIFRHLDAFSDMDLMSELKLRPPTLVALGNEGAGKSTALERLIGFPILPRADKLCTRMPLRIQLRRGPYQAARVSVWTRGANKAEVAGSAKSVPLAQLCATVQECMSAVVREQKREIVSTHEILVQIQVDYCPNLNLVDIPGLVASGDKRPGFEKLPEETEALARSVVAEEREFATFLLVVSATSAPNLSLASELVNSMNLGDRTLGVFTNLDRVVPADSDKTTGAGIAEMIHGTGAGCFRLPHGWVGCASKDPRRKELERVGGGCREVFRLRCIDLSEQEFISGLVSEAEDEDEESTGDDDNDVEKKVSDDGAAIRGVLHRVGMAAARQRVQHFFEDYLTTKWVPRIRERLLTHFYGAALTNCAIGMPIPMDPEYEPALTELTRLPAVPAARGFSADQLVAQADTVFTALLTTRVRKLATHRTSDWLQLKGMAGVWSRVAQLRARPGTQKAAWGTASCFYLEAEATVGAEEEWVRSTAGALVRELAGQARAHLAERLRGALFTPPAQPKRSEGLFARVKRAWGNFADNVPDDEEQRELVRLDRFSGLSDEYRKFIAGEFTAAADRFSAAAQALIDWAAARCVRAAYDAAGAAVNCTLHYRCATEVAELGDAILSLWFKLVVAKVAEGTQRWRAPHACREVAKGERLAALKEMLRASRVLQALSELEAMVARQRKEDATPER